MEFSTDIEDHDNDNVYPSLDSYAPIGPNGKTMLCCDPMGI